jgi:predicted enzyme related to lactoylglutathione lyase
MNDHASSACVATREDFAMTPHGHFHWTEFLARDVDRIKRFYGDVVGWTFQDTPMDGGACYTVALCGDKPVGGIFPLTSPDFDGVPEGWMPYLAVDDVDVRVAKAVAAGATLMRPIFDVPNMGRLAIPMQPGGVGVAWVTPLG